jgi:hypothetical protein
MIVTLRMLQDKYACQPQIDRLLEVFTRFSEDGIPVTRDNLRLCDNNGVDLRWFLLNILCNADVTVLAQYLDDLGIMLFDQSNDCNCTACRIHGLSADDLYRVILHICTLIDDKPVMPVSEEQPMA